MEGIGSTSDYSAVLENLLLDNVKMIRKSAILQQQGEKLGIATSVANDLAHSMSAEGYEFDADIPENSTFSLHI